MKKLLSAILSCFVWFGIFSICSSAEVYSGRYSTVEINGKQENIIKNEYFEKYGEKLFEQSYKEYCETVSKYKSIDLSKISFEDELISADEVFVESIYKFFDGFEMKKIGKQLYNEMTTSYDEYYLSVYFAYDEDFSAEKNDRLLKTVENLNEVLYVGETTPCAVVSVTGKNIDSLIANENVEFVNYAFTAISNEYTSYIPENGNRTFNPTAADARKILRYAAGLYDFSDVKNQSEIKEFYILSDTDLNGKITAKDARTVLRIAAKLEKGNSYKVNTESFWDCDFFDEYQKCTMQAVQAWANIGSIKFIKRK